ncbi:MAG: flagellar brake protein [Defluviitaleaceae bacterium]|nr:flagellar brake protein [Defluviitaleaceae bacterium]
MLSYMQKGTRVEAKNHLDDTPYITTVEELLEDGRVLLNIVRHGGLETRLSENKPYTLRFYCERGVFRFAATLLGYTRKGGKESMLFQTTDNGEKIQRRQSFRMSCGEEIELCMVENVEDEKIYYKGLIRDISGGGVKLLTTYEIDASHLVELKLPAIAPDFWVYGTILTKQEIHEDAKYSWQYGLEFIGQSNEDTDKIMHFIHEEQQKARGGTAAFRR